MHFTRMVCKLVCTKMSTPGSPSQFEIVDISITLEHLLAKYSPAQFLNIKMFKIQPYQIGRHLEGLKKLLNLPNFKTLNTSKRGWTFVNYRICCKSASWRASSSNIGSSKNLLMLTSSLMPCSTQDSTSHTHAMSHAPNKINTCVNSRDILYRSYCFI